MDVKIGELYNSTGDSSFPSSPLLPECECSVQASAEQLRPSEAWPVLTPTLYLVTAYRLQPTSAQNQRKSKCKYLS